jgi:hypothetical protein
MLRGMERVVEHRSTAEMTAALDHLRSAPREQGTLELVVRRPEIETREVLDEAILDPEHGVVGDTWERRPSRMTPDNSPELDRQLTVMGIRFAAFIAGEPDRIPLAGDQLYVDLDLSVDNLPAGTRLAIGDAVIEITEPPHTGCGKFVSRFGVDAQKFVNSPVGRELRLRGANARVVLAGAVRPGDAVRKLVD